MAFPEVTRIIAAQLPSATHRLDSPDGCVYKATLPGRGRRGRFMAFPLFTSVKPPTAADDLAYLRDCLNSWCAAGFTPIAVNGPSEIKKLRDLELPAEFAPLPTDGKPRIGAILEAIRGSGAPCAGIINADCRLMAYPNLASNLRADLAGRAILAWRLDTGGENDMTAEPDGLDGFFFDTRHLPTQDAGFTIGAAFWDTWFPVALAAAGARVGKIDVPLMTHRRHAQTWDLNAWLAGAQRGFTAFRAMPRELEAFRDIPAAWWSRERLNAVHLIKLGRAVTDWTIRTRMRVSILPPAMAEIEAALRAGIWGMMAAQRLAAMENSTSWKITAPLRWALGTMRSLLARGVPPCA
jgi:hypothetical protein